MSIAALMVDLNDLPSYTQEDDGVVYADELRKRAAGGGDI